MQSFICVCAHSGSYTNQWNVCADQWIKTNTVTLSVSNISWHEPNLCAIRTPRMMLYTANYFSRFSGYVLFIISRKNIPVQWFTLPAKKIYDLKCHIDWLTYCWLTQLFPKFTFIGFPTPTTRSLKPRFYRLVINLGWDSVWDRWTTA